MDNDSHPVSGKRSVPVIKRSSRRRSKADSSSWTTFQKAYKVFGGKDGTGASRFFWPRFHEGEHTHVLRAKAYRSKADDMNLL